MSIYANIDGVCKELAGKDSNSLIGRINYVRLTNSSVTLSGNTMLLMFDFQYTASSTVNYHSISNLMFYEKSNNNKLYINSLENSTSSNGSLPSRSAFNNIGPSFPVTSVYMGSNMDSDISVPAYKCTNPNTYDACTVTIGRLSGSVFTLDSNLYSKVTYSNDHFSLYYIILS